MSLSYFLKQNKIKKENVKFAPTTSILDENGKPIEWEIKHISSKENEIIRNECIIDVPIKGKSNAFRQKVDISKYINKLIVSSVVFPNLYSKELQDSYGVMTPEDLVLEIIDNPAEYNNFVSFIQNINGFDNDINSKIDYSKN